MELQKGVKLPAQRMISKYDILIHWLPTCEFLQRWLNLLLIKSKKQLV